MTPFLQFRIWFRRASAAQKGSGLLAVAMVVALLVWTAVPSGSPAGSHVGMASSGSSSGSSGGGIVQPAGGAVTTTVASRPSPAQAGSSGSPPASLPSSGGGGVAQSPSAAPPATTGGHQAPTAASPGQSSQAATSTTQSCTTKGTLKIGVVVPNEAGGQLNPVFGIPTQSQEEADYGAAIDAINKAGGAGCYTLTGEYLGVDGTNPSTAQSDCLTFAQDHVFAVMGGFLPAATDDCLMQHHLPTFEQIPVPAAEVKQYYPYYFSVDPTFEVLYRNFAEAIQKLGYLSSAHHFAKMGVFYRDCIPSVNAAMVSDLAAVGISGSKLVRYDLGCPTPQPYAAPQAVQQAILQFKTEGVTTVTVDNDYEDIQQLSKTAQTQGFHPVWVIPDTGVSAVSSAPEFQPDPNNFNGALAITPEQYGAIESSLPESAGTQACDKIMASHGLPTVYKSADQYAGSACSLMWMLVAAIQHGGANPAGLAAGLQAARTTQYSFPDGPDDFSAPGTTTGGEFWRPITFSGSCGCWKVQSAAWNPSFP